MLIGFTGPAGCGKDTAVKHLRDIYCFERVAFADPIKAALNAMFGWSMRDWDNRDWKEAEGKFGFSPRKAAQTLGTEWGRGLNNNLWLELAEDNINSLLFSGYPVAVSDVRFDNEAEMIRRKGGKIVHILRDSVTPVLSHASECGIVPAASDLLLPNNSTIEKFLFDLDWLLKLGSGNS